MLLIYQECKNTTDGYRRYLKSTVYPKRSTLPIVYPDSGSKGIYMSRLRLSPDRFHLIPHQATMAEYTSSREGYERTMLRGLADTEDVRTYLEATTTPSFHHTMNGVYREGEACVENLRHWRTKAADFKLKVSVSPCLSINQAHGAR